MDACHSQRSRCDRKGCAAPIAPEKVKEGGWLKRKEVKVVPSKLVFTVKPPDRPAEGVTPHAAQQGQASTNPVPHATGRVRPRANARPAWLLAATTHRAPALRCTRQVQQPKLFVVLWFFVQRGVGGQGL